MSFTCVSFTINNLPNHTQNFENKIKKHSESHLQHEKNIPNHTYNINN